MEKNYPKKQNELSSEASNGRFDKHGNGLDQDFFAMPQKSQKLTFGEVVLFMLQVTALVLLFMYIYKTPSNSSEREVKGITITAGGS